jgi:hypothetical protein
MNGKEHGTAPTGLVPTNESAPPSGTSCLNTRSRQKLNIRLFQENLILGRGISGKLTPLSVDNS